MIQNIIFSVDFELFVASISLLLCGTNEAL